MWAYSPMLWPISQLRVTNLCCNEAVIFGPNIYFHRTATRQKHNYLALGALHLALICGSDLFRKQTINNGALPTAAAVDPILLNQLYYMLERRTMRPRRSVSTVATELILDVTVFNSVEHSASLERRVIQRVDVKCYFLWLHLSLSLSMQ